MIALISIFATITGTLVLHRNYRSKQSGLLFLRSKKGNTSPISIFLSNKILGFIIIGLIPGIIVFATLPSGTSMPGLSFEYNWDYWYLLGLPVLITGINYFLAKNPNIMKSYPEMRFAEWNKTRLAVLVLGWTIYLSAYEFLFRGILFFFNLSVLRTFSFINRQCCCLFRNTLREREGRNGRCNSFWHFTMLRIAAHRIIYSSFSDSFVAGTINCIFLNPQ